MPGSRGETKKTKLAKTSIVQVPVDAEFLERIDHGASMLRESRAAFVREACADRLKALEDAVRDRRYEAGYRKTPETTPWANMSAKALASLLSKET